MKAKAVAPVIVIGMHRSGTTLVARLLEDLGLFVGHKKEQNHEAILFQRLNDWMLRQSGGAWDYPKPVHGLIADPVTRELVEDYLQFVLSSTQAASFLGWLGYLQYRSVFKLDRPWGWKDPRNTFTLPIWLDLFPGAKVVHVYRHGVDVAQSLKVRRNRMLEQGKARYFSRKPLYALRLKMSGFSHSTRCASLEGGFSLWEEYIAEASKHVRALGSRALEIRYEDLLQNPVPSLRKLAVFVGLNVTEAAIEAAAKRISRERAYAYQENPTLREFAQGVSDRLKTFGY